MNRDLQGHYITISTVGEKAQALFRPRCRLHRQLNGLQNSGKSLIRPCWPSVVWTVFRYCSRTPRSSLLSDLLLFEFEHQPGVPLDDVQEDTAQQLMKLSAEDGKRINSLNTPDS